MNYSIKLSIILFALFVSCNSSNENVGKNDIEIIDDYSAKIDSLIKTTSPRKFNGVISITQNGHTKYSKEYGYSDFEKMSKIATTDNFRIQSNSKQITAVLVLREVENGKINLESPIKVYLPDLKQSWADKVTVHQLLNMSAGIEDVNKPLLFEPGSDFKYSNPAYGILGQIIESVSGKSYVEMANGLFKELKMLNSFCYELGKYQNKVVNGYVNSNNEFDYFDFYSNKVGFTEENWKSFIPAGGIISNLNDLNIWDAKLHNGKILKEKTYKLMINYNITSQHNAFGPEKVGYGYGLRISDKKTFKQIGHAGKGLGFVSIKIYIPEKQVCVIVLENQYSRDANIVYHFENEIREIVLNSNLMK